MTLYGICMIAWKRDAFWCSGGFKNVGFRYFLRTTSFKAIRIVMRFSVYPLYTNLQLHGGLEKVKLGRAEYAVYCEIMCCCLVKTFGVARF